MKKIDVKSVNTMKMLSAEAVQKANSGHPGMPLGASPIVFSLYANHLHFDPKRPFLQNRDRFVLSAGHASMMLYSVNHLFGFDITISDIKNFRQFGSVTPGHPEYKHTPGVEATTGPLGAGASMAVGMAISEAHLASIFNKKGYDIIDNYTYALLGDGCMMEGVSNEAFSLAGNLKLNKLIILYDSNNITIEGKCDIAFTDDTVKRMESYGFYTQVVKDGCNLDKISKAIENAKKQKDKPSFIKINTTIGCGCPKKEGTSSCHGEPLGEENLEELRKTLGYEHMEPFFVADEVYKNCQSYVEKKLKKQEKYEKMKAEYFEKYPEMKALYEEYFNFDCEKIINDESVWVDDTEDKATRTISGEILNRIKNKMKNLVGGSADLAPSNKTEMKGAGSFSFENRSGRNIHFGVREMAMGGIGNGIALYGGLRPYVSTFFVFSDYLKPMIRLSALMGLPVCYILTHDSIGVGEDGPTHEPVEQLAMLRSTPNLITFRPADTKETNEGWKQVLKSQNTPVALILSRQNLPQLKNTGKGASYGGYIVEKEAKEKPDLIIIATGSELSLAIKAREAMLNENIDARVVSMPSIEIFESQNKEYRESVLPSSVLKRLVIEAGSSFGWGKYTGLEGKTVTMDYFGASAPSSVLFKEFGFTVENIVKTAKELISK